MKKEDFIKLGLDEESAQKAADAYAQAVDGFVPKARLDEVIKEKKHYEAEFKRIDGELTEIKKSSGDTDELNSKITELQGQIEKGETKHKSEVKQIKIENAIKEQGAKRTKSVLSEIDVDKISIDDDGNLVGLNEQLTTLKGNEETSFLFVGEKELGFKGANPTDPQSKKTEEIDFKTATYEELAAHLETGGELPE